MNGINHPAGAQLTIVPVRQFLDLQPLLAGELEGLAASIEPGQFASLLEPLMRQTLAKGFAEAGADEGTVWLVDRMGENLVPAYNTGPQADELVDAFKQPLRAGLVGMVFASEQPFLENEVWKNSAQSKLLDQKLRVQTWSMIAVPFYFLRRCRGVVSCVQLKRNPAEAAPAGFQPQNLKSVQQACAMLTQLIDFRLLSEAVGWGRD